MPQYIEKILHKLLHIPPKRRQYAPYKCTEPVYGQKMQYVLPKSTLPVLDKKGITRTHVINGTFIYHARAIDPYMLPVINEISSQQAHPTHEANNKAAFQRDSPFMVIPLVEGQELQYKVRTRRKVRTSNSLMEGYNNDNNFYGKVPEKWHKLGVYFMWHRIQAN